MEPGDGSLGLSVLVRFVLVLVSDSSWLSIELLSGLLRFRARCGVDGDGEEEEEAVASVSSVRRHGVSVGWSSFVLLRGKAGLAVDFLLAIFQKSRELRN